MRSLETFMEHTKELSRLINIVYAEADRPFFGAVEEFVNGIHVSEERMLATLQTHSLEAQKDDTHENVIERGIIVDVYSPLCVIIGMGGSLLETAAEQPLELCENQKQSVQLIDQVTWQILFYWEDLRRKVYGPPPDR